MFKTQIPMGIKSIKVKAEFEDGITTRLCTLTLGTEFDAIVAAGIGRDAVEALGLLRGKGMKSCVLPIDRITCEGLLVADSDRLVIGRLLGTKATGKSGEEDESPRIELEFTFLFDQAAWGFLGRHAGAQVIATLTPTQLALPNVVSIPRLAADKEIQ
jgi:hypothetical protein